MITSVLIYAGICVSGVILTIICAGMIALGNMIATTPDGQELRGERIRDEVSKMRWSSPEQLPKALSYAFSAIFVIGSAMLVVGNGDTLMLILGGMTVFSALFFGIGVIFFEMMMYNRMIANVKEQREYVQAIRS